MIELSGNAFDAGSFASILLATLLTLSRAYGRKLRKAAESATLQKDTEAAFQVAEAEDILGTLMG